MYNPFPLLTEGLLDDKIKEGKRYFVRQTYPRGMLPRLKASFLFKAYEESEKELATAHFSSLQRDPHAYLYEVSQPEHLEKLRIAAKQPFGYRIYYAGKKGLDWKPPTSYQLKMQNYIKTKHPGWRTKPGGDKIQIGLYEEFGELFLKLSFEQEEEKIPFATIENY